MKKIVKEYADRAGSTIFAVAAFAGLRRGEIRGLRWEDYRDGALYVARSVWRGHVGRPAITPLRCAFSSIAFAVAIRRPGPCLQT